MTDQTTTSAAPTSVSKRPVDDKEARRRLRARYRSDLRLRIYGIAALVVTTLFLIFLLADIVRNALPVFMHHHAILDVKVPADLVEADARKDPAAIRNADYFPLIRDALSDAVPGVEGRRAQRQLAGLLSTGADIPIRDRLVEDPSVIGTTLRVPLMFSATADLYLKGMATPVSTRSGAGTAKPDGTTGEISITSTSPDFAADLATLKAALSDKVAAIRREADRLERAGTSATIARARELREDAQTLEARADRRDAAEKLDDTMPSVLVAINGGLVKISEIGGSEISGTTLLPLKSDAAANPQSWQVLTYATPASSRKITDQEIAYLERLKADGRIEERFNWQFLTAGDSREPELAGIRGALIGTALTLLVTLVICLPVGVAAAVYLEEFAPKNRLTEIVEVNINNLAAVPSIVFGLLGLAMFLNFFGLPRSAPLVGGLVLALLVLPTIIIASRAAIKAVPPSIKEAALGVGASHQQAVFHHVLPLAMPGIMTGTIIGMAHALGETAPLLMIGMVAFIVDVPKGITDAATVLPVQIFLWSDLPEPAFQYRTAGAIVVLLGFLFAMNGAAIWLRKKFEKRW